MKTNNICACVCVHVSPKEMIDPCGDESNILTTVVMDTHSIKLYRTKSTHTLKVQGKLKNCWIFINVNILVAIYYSFEVH